MSVRKSSHGTMFLIVSSGSPRALIASSLRSTSKKPFCPMTRSLHPSMTAHGHRVRFVATWREEFFEVPFIRYLLSFRSVDESYVSDDTTLDGRIYLFYCLIYGSFNQLIYLRLRAKGFGIRSLV